MGRWRIVLGLLTAIVTTSGYADPSLVWLHIKPSYKYSDPKVTCSTEDTALGAESAYFGVEREDELTLSARLQMFKTPSPISSPLELDAKELSGLRLHTDSNGRVWVAHFPSSLRIVNWLTYYSAAPLYGCRPPSRLVTAEGLPVTLGFPTAGLGEAFPTATTPVATIKGLTKQGDAYTLDISLTERQPPGEP